jgi:hypothetical protein
VEVPLDTDQPLYFENVELGHWQACNLGPRSILESVVI